MRHLSIAVACLLGVAFAAHAADVITTVGKTCETVNLITTHASSSIYFQSHHALAITLEDGGSGAVVNPETCTSALAAQCDDYVWDHDTDGVKSQTTLNGVGSTFTRGVAMPNAPTIRVEITTAPSADGLARVSACPML